CARWSARLGRPLTGTERCRAHAAARLYERIAADDPGRYLVLDLDRHTTDQALSVLTSAIGALPSPAGVPS
ncbi:hypothetical protein, partial [Streptomyces zhihengii]|uniref:hypothetical protein n=1 Tax=Streptomyces zhihengii TaxID=1818004 RepID=UPI0033BD9E65